MKTSNIQPSHPHAIIRGWVSSQRAGSTGITVEDGTTTAVDIIRILINGGTVVDNGDGTISITVTSPDNLWFNVQDYGAVGDGVTDDTAAIQATIDACAVAGGGVIYFPPGHYIIAGALQDTGSFNGQILLPNVSTSDPQITIVFKGPLPPPYTVAGPQPEPGGYAILESTISGGTGTAAVFSAGNGTWPTKTNVRVHVEDLICLNHVNPSLTFWNLTISQAGGSHGLYITTPDWDLTPTTEPTHSNAYGIKLPQWGESNGARWEFMVGGHYNGFLQGELADTFPIIGQCKRAIVLPFSEHPSKIHAHVTAGTPITVTGENRATIWIDIEHYTDPPFSGAAAWLVTTVDLDDAGDDLYGDITWFSLDGVTQVPDHIFTINGGANAQTREIGDPPPSSSPTGPAGGDLSGTYPNPSVVDDSHSHTAATLPATTSGVDHEHVMNLWFSGDGTTTVFELPAAAFDSQSVRAWVSGTLTDVTLSGTLLTTMTFGSAPASGTNNIVVDLVAAAA